VQGAGTPVFLAVVPASFVAQNGGTPDAALSSLHRALGQPGTYGLVAGRTFRANSTEFAVGSAARKAAADNQGGTSYEVLTDFVTGVADLAASGAAADGSGGLASPGGTPSGGFPWGWLLLGGAVAGGGALAYRGYRSSKAKAAAELEQVRHIVEEDVTRFGEELAAFDVADPRLDDAGRADLQRALDDYDRAKAAGDSMVSAAGADAVTAALSDGRFAMECVRARLEGRPLPELRPPCFFDPRHGPSVEDLVWSPPGGQPRPVPACAACATTLKAGELPPARMVPAGGGGQAVPYWLAGPQFGGYAGGYYQSFGGVLPGILVGTVLGGMMSGPGYADGGYAPGGDAGAGSGGGSDTGWAGGFGGGDFGGGGGDFGGGDFGGGGDGGF
jgi:hypothetical protein